MTLEAVLSQYGFAALFLGAGIEGETVVVLGGVMVHRGLIAYPAAIAAAALGSFIADQIFFGSDDGDAPIDRYVLRVQQPVAVAVEAYACLEQFGIIGSLGKVHEPLVHNMRNDKVDRDAACDRVLERGQQGFVGDQIGRDDGDILLRLVNEFDEQSLIALSLIHI